MKNQSTKKPKNLSHQRAQKPKKYINHHGHKNAWAEKRKQRELAGILYPEESTVRNQMEAT